MSEAKQSKAGKSSAAQPIRCPCGSLLARLVPGGVELKCRRCKRQVVIPLTVGLNHEKRRETVHSNR